MRHHKTAMFLVELISSIDKIGDVAKVEKPLNFDPFGHAELSLLAKI